MCRQPRGWRRSQDRAGQRLQRCTSLENQNKTQVKRKERSCVQRGNVAAAHRLQVDWLVNSVSSAQMQSLGKKKTNELEHNWKSFARCGSICLYKLNHRQCRDVC